MCMHECRVDMNTAEDSVEEELLEKFLPCTIKAAGINEGLQSSVELSES